MKFYNAFKIGVVCFAFALALHDGAGAQISEHDITVGRTIDVPGPSGLVYRDDGFWVVSWSIGEGTRLHHYSSIGVLLGNYSVPEEYLVQGLAWDGTHWWIADNIHPSGDKIKKCELTSTGLNVLKEYIWPGPGSGPVALELAQGYLWVADNHSDLICRVTVGDTSFTSVEPWSSGNISPYGLAWDGTNMWSSCSPAGGGISGPREIYKHDANGNIIEIWHYPGAPGPPPGAYGGCATDIAFVGNRLWYCDYDKNQIIEAIRGAGIGLVAYYPFNGNANDESGNGNYGSLIGGATWTTGVLDGAVHLDGTGYINVPDSPSLDLSGGTGTIAAFIRVDPASNMSNEFGVSKESSSSYASTIAYEFLVRENASGKMVEYCIISDGTSCNYINNEDGESLKDSLWHHIALTWSGPGGKFVAYRDGVVVAEGDQTISTINNIPEPVFIGAFRWNVPPGIVRKMTGDIDEVRIYNRALSANEISELAGITESTEGWIAFGSNRDGDLDIWAVRPDGTGLRQITNLPGAEFTPQWSPDSTKIAYATATDAQIWVYDWFAGTNTKIFDGDDYGGMYYAAEPAWSPDGKRILFHGQTTYNNPHIAMINADGSGRRIIVPIEGGYVSGTSWCPTGTAFVYSIRNSGASFSHDLWIYDFTSTGDITNGVNHRLTAGAGSESTTKNYPDWTPSGKILFTWGHNLAIIDPGRSPNWVGPISSPSDPHVTFLTNDAGYPSIVYSYPSWSPDLSQVVYADESAATATYDLWIIDAHPGGSRYPVMTTPYGESYPDWGNPTPQPPPPLKVYYVDAVNGNDNNDGLTRRTAFATIHKGIDSSRNSFKVLVYPGVYQEEVDFKGKAIAVQGVATKAGIPIIENPGDFVVSFYNGEGPRSILKNFVIRNSFMGIFIAGSSPTIKNLNVVDNKYGIESYAGAEPDISNCIFWNNSDSDLFGCEARCSCTSQAGQSNIDADPCFVEPDNGDYHLLSERGRYWPEHDVWVLDKVTSPCIDGGDPKDDASVEPMPNGKRIDMGAFGGTPFASMSEIKCLDGDVNHDGVVNLIDLTMLVENWLKAE